ncbi:Ribonucleoside-diphosphate reductase large subunit [Tetrabaena socialis]|uniref:Ribonucleoside-diphosphate reductase large subunit n=1 Tax=Tetrabaena socialis TaxID=47790 RepID=A0A2J7ZQJ1_9CHLO|nr:Ribonucleoside-diphosphate reductase large subunit [Tetrabaena socialis]|eukprot:PNH02534.1 Ribonucleoside-diphosphate reductase large subunit [Tetrabaena socialis]
MPRVAQESPAPFPDGFDGRQWDTTEHTAVIMIEDRAWTELKGLEAAEGTQSLGRADEFPESGLGLEGIPRHIKDIYKIVWEIKQKALIDMAADRGSACL